MSNIAVALLLFNIFNNFLNPYILTKGSKIYNSKEIFNNQSLFPIYFSILTAIISCIVLYFLFKVFKFDFEFYVNLVLAYYLLFLAIDLLKRVSQISNNFKIYSTSLAIDKVIFLCLILFFFLFGYNLNAYNLLFLVNISCLFSILFIILILKRNLNLKFNGSFELKNFIIFQN